MSALSRTFVACVLGITVLSHCSRTQAKEDGPFYQGSFKAIGEIIRSKSKGDIIEQHVEYIEEVYDKTRNTAALKIRSAKRTSSFFQDIGTKQTFYYGQDENPSFCKLMNDTADPESGELRFLNSDNGRSYLFLKDILAIKNWRKTSDLQFSRNISTQVWVTESKYNDHNLIIATAISGANWSSTAANVRAPITVDIHHIIGDDGENTQINIFSFQDFEGTLHYDNPQLPDGVFCNGYKKNVDPPKLEKITAFNYRAEMWSSMDKLVHTSDVWIDMNRALYRMDFKPVTVGNSSQITIIVSGNEKTIYMISREPVNQCNMTAITELEIDPQMVMDPRYVLHITPSVFFSGDNEKLSLSYKKQTEKRGIPCHVWQALRSDWPPDSAGLKTLWEWCIAMPEKQDVQGANVYLVNLDVSVLEVPKEGSSLNLSVGAKLSFRFYDAMINPPELIDLHGFDISPCYEDNEMADMRITVKLSSKEYQELFADSTLYDPRFLSAWRSALEKSSGLSDSSLRITRIKASFQDTALLVQFTMLDRFPARAHTGIVDDQANLEEMKSNLQAAIDARQLCILYKGINLVASSGSLSPVTDVPGTEPPTTTSSDSYTDVWEIVTNPDEETTSAVVLPTGSPSYELPNDRYSAATLAGTTTAMFVLGALLGASGTYVKSKVLTSGEPVRYRFWA